MRWTEDSFLKSSSGAAFARRAIFFLKTALPPFHYDLNLMEGPLGRFQTDVGFLAGAALSGAHCH